VQHAQRPRAGGFVLRTKGTYVEGGLGRLRPSPPIGAYSKAQAKGLFPLAFNIADIDLNGRRNCERHRDRQQRLSATRSP